MILMMDSAPSASTSMSNIPPTMDPTPSASTSTSVSPTDTITTTSVTRTRTRAARLKGSIKMRLRKIGVQLRTLRYRCSRGGPLINKYWPWRLVRLPAFFLTLLWSATTLGISISETFPTRSNLGVDTSFGKIMVAVTAIETVSILAMVIVDYVRPGTILSWLVFEIIWLSILFILVLSALLDVITSASYIVDIGRPPLFAGCTNIGFLGYSFPGDNSACEAWIPIIVLSSFNLATLLGYLCFILATMIIRKQRGHRITWTATVRDTDFLACKTDQPASLAITKFWPWWLVRLPAFGLIIMCSAVNMGLSIHTFYDVEPAELSPVELSPYGPISVGVAGLTIGTLGIMLFVDYFWPGTKFSWVITELIWFAILQVFWAFSLFIVILSSIFGNPDNAPGYAICESIEFSNIACQAWRAVLSMDTLGCVLIALYKVFLVSSLCVRRKRGHKIFWSATVRDTDFLEWKKPYVPRTKNKRQSGGSTMSMGSTSGGSVNGDDGIVLRDVGASGVGSNGDVIRRGGTSAAGDGDGDGIV